MSISISNQYRVDGSELGRIVPIPIEYITKSDMGLEGESAKPMTGGDE